MMGTAQRAALQVLTLHSININGITSSTKVRMFHHFVQRSDTDIMFLQEVTSAEILQIPGYVAHCNIGTEMRGTAMLVRENITLDNIVRAPSGRAMAAVFLGILLLNVYAPSGTSRKAEREEFYNLDLPPLLRSDVPHLMCGGDFNCVLQPCDVTCQFNRCKALGEFVTGYSLIDTWTQNALHPTFTFYHANGASRIDRFYVTHGLAAQQTGIRIIPAAFTDHCAVELRMRIPTYSPPVRRRFWTLHPALLRDQEIQQQITLAWGTWKRRRRFYPDVAMWWERCVTSVKIFDPSKNGGASCRS